MKFSVALTFFRGHNAVDPYMSSHIDVYGYALVGSEAAEAGQPS